MAPVAQQPNALPKEPVQPPKAKQCRVVIFSYPEHPAQRLGEPEPSFTCRWQGRRLELENVAASFPQVLGYRNVHLREAVDLNERVQLVLSRRVILVVSIFRNFWIFQLVI